MPDFRALLTKTAKVQILLNNKTVIELDCSVSEKHGQESPPTEFPVENGQTISDHIVIKPIELELQGIISNAPLDGLANRITGALLTGISAVAPSPAVLGPGAAGFALLPLLSRAEDRTITIYQQLLDLQTARFPVDVLTSLKFYRNMWITSLSVPRDAKSGQALFFTLKFKQLLLVTPTSVAITIFKEPDTSAGRGDKGRKEAAAPNGFNKGFADVNSLVGGH